MTGHPRLGLWQSAMRYLLPDESAFDEDDLTGCDALMVLLFRLETSPDPARVVVPTNAVLALFQRHPGFDDHIVTGPFGKCGEWRLKRNGNGRSLASIQA